MSGASVPDTIVEACKAGLMRYGDAIRAYWPAAGEVDVTEAAFVANLAVDFSRRDCHVYATPQVRDAAKEHVDFLAVSADGTWAVAVEGKRMYSAAKAASLGEDADRLMRLRLPREHGAPKGAPRCFVGVVASVWAKQDAYRSWWLGSDRVAPPRGARKLAHWTSLAAFLSGACAGEVDVQLEGKTPHWMLFAIREVGRGTFWLP